ncbi:hypothetical protein VCJ71_12325 [Alteriqipengyuania sp. WL0013]|uniref:hypothetical protein n=1 Tax=Alteriqipengyuania sp. WL0013 TaxID=3110773 RepID=UPI002C6C297F|nr:hypothetical protein [Alteriqipengyuania sp. WL0013]MEB3416849.1 hypothetical protein [Alteriqipengyuania sp. WL0013]
MEKFVVWCRGILLGLGVVGAAALAYALARSGLNHVVPNGNVLVDYVNVVVILLTTVTVFFTVAAIALAILGIWGFRNIKSDAAKSAEDSVKITMKDAFEPNGVAYNEIREEIIDESGPLGKWLRQEIQRQVTEQLTVRRAQLVVDEDDATDEGDQE